MSSRIVFAAVALILLAPQSVMAIETVNTEVSQTDQGESSTDKITLSESDRIRADLWNLSDVEWHRYKLLMQGIRGSISPATISPIEVLGIHARDDAERQQYAESWAQAMREDVRRILVFQRAYNTAAKQLYPNDPVIDVSRLPVKPVKLNALTSADRLLFFTRTECPACDFMMGKLLKRLDDISGIDVYLMDVGPGNDTEVRAWAAKQKIDHLWVKSRRVTLNYDGGTLEKLSKGQGEVPYILRRRDEKLMQIRLSDL
ncbi:MAG: TIGR03759 family integrating conjugative element protein [Pseudomonadota bacterium]|nr:TIGR03759 family integrating conjugative element protein [Pseudomonadota bacterium]